MAKLSKIQIANNYANALLEAALAENTLPDVWKDCQKLQSYNEGLLQLNILNNPVFKSEEKKNIITDIASSLQLSQTSQNFLELVASKRRFNELPAILEQFTHLYHKNQEILEVEVESVQKLSAEQNKKLKNGLEKLLNQKIILNYNINPKIIGGLKISYNSVCIDDSIAAKLKTLEQVMKGNK